VHEIIYGGIDRHSRAEVRAIKTTKKRKMLHDRVTIVETERRSRDILHS
jgi:hypothetical protein